MANSFRGLLPNGQLPSQAEAQVRDLISTEAPPPDLSAYSTTVEVEDMIDAATGGGATIPIFRTLAEAQAYEDANPGKMALTVQPSGVDTEPPVAGALAVDPGDQYADLTVTGASDNFLSVEYSFRAGATKGAGTWSSWTTDAEYSLGSLTKNTTYYFQHRVRDGAGFIVEGTPVQATTLDSVFTTGSDTFGTYTGSIVGRVMETGGLTWEAGDGAALITTSGTPMSTSGVVTSGVAALTMDKPQMEATITIAERSGTMLRVGVATSSSNPYLVQVQSTSTALYGPGTTLLANTTVPSGVQNPTVVTVGYNGADVYVRYGATEVLRHKVGALTGKLFAVRPHNWTVDSVEVRAL